MFMLSWKTWLALMSLLVSVLMVSAVPVAAREKDPDPALITVTVRPSLNSVSQRGGVVSYVIEVVNRGRGRAKNAHLTVPFEPSVTALLDVQTSTSEAWVTTVNQSTLVMDTGPLDDRDVVTATVRLQTLPAVPDGAPVSRRTTFFFADDQDDGSGSANLPTVVAGSADENRETYPLDVSPAAGPSGSTYTFRTTIFIPKESVSLWYSAPGGQVQSLDAADADSDGAVSVALTTAKLAPGTYTMVAHGDWTGFTASGTFVVQ